MAYCGSSDGDEDDDTEKRWNGVEERVVEHETGFEM